MEQKIVAPLTLGMLALLRKVRRTKQAWTGRRAWITQGATVNWDDWNHCIEFRCTAMVEVFFAIRFDSSVKVRR